MFAYFLARFQPLEELDKKLHNITLFDEENVRRDKALRSFYRIAHLFNEQFLLIYSTARPELNRPRSKIKLPLYNSTASAREDLSTYIYVQERFFKF